MPVTLSNSAARWPNVFLSGDGELAKGVNGLESFTPMASSCSARARGAWLWAACGFVPRLFGAGESAKLWPSDVAVTEC